MTKLIKKSHKNITIFSNHIVRDSHLSWKARGIFMYLWSLPSNWKFHEDEIATHSTDGINALNTGVKELQQNGYLIVNRKRNKYGQMKKSAWILDDNPDLKKPNLANPNFDNSNLSNRKLLNTNNTKHLSKQNTDSTNNTDNGKPNIRQMIVKDLESLMVNINTFVAQDIDDWIKDYDPKLILKAIHQVGSTSPSPTWVVKDISTQLSRGCQVYQPKRRMNYGNKPDKRYLPDWAKKGYHQKLHPTDKKTQEKIKKQLKDLDKRSDKK